MGFPYLDTPASPLARFIYESKQDSVLVLLTGPSLSGKTSCCLALARWARRTGLEVGGLVCPAVVENGRRQAIDMLDLSSGQSRRLAQARLARARPDEDGGLIVGRWRFEPSTLAWGNQVLAAVQRPDWLILDEVGPLEFERGAGLQEGLRLVDQRRARLNWVVVRPRLLDAALDRWPWAQIVDVRQVKMAALPDEAEP